MESILPQMKSWKRGKVISVQLLKFCVHLVLESSPKYVKNEFTLTKTSVKLKATLWSSKVIGQ